MTLLVLAPAPLRGSFDPLHMENGLTPIGRRVSQFGIEIGAVEN